MAKVRVIQVKNVGETKTAFVYRGFYCINGGVRAFHSPNVLRNNSNIDRIVVDEEFNLAHGRIDTVESFKEIVDEHIEYLERAFGSLERYFRLNMGEI